MLSRSTMEDGRFENLAAVAEDSRGQLIELATKSPSTEIVLAAWTRLGTTGAGGGTTAAGGGSSGGVAAAGGETPAVSVVGAAGGFSVDVFSVVEGGATVAELFGNDGQRRRGRVSYVAELPGWSSWSDAATSELMRSSTPSLARATNPATISGSKRSPAPASMALSPASADHASL